MIRSIGIFVGGMIVIGAIGFSMAFPIITEDYVVTTVKKLERECRSMSEGTDCRYMVYTDGEVFENTDSIVHMKWDSSDVQNNMEEGQNYRLKVYGWRIPFLSQYRNIVSANKV